MLTVAERERDRIPKESLRPSGEEFVKPSNIEEYRTVGGL